MRFWWFFFSSTLSVRLKLSSKPKSWASDWAGSTEVVSIKAKDSTTTGTSLTKSNWNIQPHYIQASLLDLVKCKICRITCISPICWHGVVQVGQLRTAKFGWVDSRAHRVCILACSLWWDGDWTPRGCYWWFHCFGFGLSWENQIALSDEAQHNHC